ncbi:MAG: hypothetical protein RJA98_1335 [Pseudomonadota bacterium]|jgi:predicted GTPase
MGNLIGDYWRHVTFAALLLLPPIALTVLGLYTLLHSEWVWWGLGAMSVAGLVGAWLAHSLRAEAMPRSPWFQPVGAEWAPAEQAAWSLVEDLAMAAQGSPPGSLQGIQDLADEVVQRVAKHLHGDTDFPWARFTLPEILLAAERAAAHLREAIRSRVPGSEQISLAQVLAVRRFYLSHHRKIAFGMKAGKVLSVLYRTGRLVVNPPVAVATEFKGWAQGAALDKSYQVVLGWMARLLVEELGRAAIDLYSGRLRVTGDEARRALLSAAPEATSSVPVKVILVGQTNAGKSSLTNALLGEVKSLVSELPATDGLKPFRVGMGAERDLVVIDTPGLAPTGQNQVMLLEAMQSADLVLWVTQANNPARAIEVDTLSALRNAYRARPEVRPPPMALVMMHADRLSPVKEWSPPYDLAAADSAKGKAIRDALQHVTQALGFNQQLSIPVALPPGGLAYNVEALWEIIGATLPDAQHTALDRALKRGGQGGIGRTMGQLVSGGRFFVGKLWTDYTGPISR